MCRFQEIENSQFISAYKNKHRLHRKKFNCIFKQCVSCDEYKTLDLLKRNGLRKDGSVMYGPCKQCSKKKSKKQREKFKNNATPEQQKRRQKRAKARYKKFIEANGDRKEYRKQWEESKPDEYWQKINKAARLRAKEKREQEWLETNATSEVHIYKCGCCGDSVVRRKYRFSELCNRCLARVKSYQRHGTGLIRQCNVCNKTYNFLLSQNSSQSFCSDECRDERKKELRNHSIKTKDRCRMYGVYYDPLVSKDKVLKRDKRRCQCCGVKCNQSDHLADNYGELDHITPLSLGGNHTYSNVQILCRVCNMVKSNNTWNNDELYLIVNEWRVSKGKPTVYHRHLVSSNSPKIPEQLSLAI